jgi:NAD(P)H dehydrogenase (quinone)
MITISAATGKFGQLIVPLLLEHVKPSELNLVVRDPAKAEAFAAQGLRIHQADYSDFGALVKGFQGTDKLLFISAFNSMPESIQHHQNVIDAAKQAGVKHIIYTSFIDSDPASPSQLGRLHGETEAYLQASGVAWTILRNGVYADEVMREAAQPLQTGVLASATNGAGVSFITRNDLAQATVAVLLGQGHEGKIYTPTGSAAITHEQFAQLLSEVTGKPIQYAPISFEQLAAGLRQAGLPDMLISLFVGMNKATAQGRTGLVTQDFERLTGRAPEPYEAVVRRALANTGARA